MPIWMEGEMRAKQTITRDLSERKKSLESLFNDVVSELYPSNPPADLNILAITATKTTLPRDSTAQSIVNYFRARYQRLIALDELIDTMPLLNKNFEEGVLNRPPDEYLASILETIRKNHQEIKEKSRGETLTKRNQEHAAYLAQYQQLHQEISTLNSSAPGFLEKFNDLTARQQALNNEITKFKDLLTKEQEEITTNQNEYLAIQTANPDKIQSYLETNTFSETIGKIMAASVEPPLPKKISRALQKKLSEDKNKAENFYSETLQDLQERNFFYQELTGQYLDKESTLNLSKKLTNDYQDLITKTQKISTVLTTDKAMLSTKQKIFQKAQNQKQTEELKKNYEKSFLNLVREKITLKKPNEETRNLKDKLTQISKKIKDSEKLAEEFTKLQKNMSETSKEISSKYQEAIQEHLKDLEQFKKLNEEEINSVHDKVDELYNSSKDVITHLNTDIQKLSKKIAIAQEQITYAQGKLPATEQKISTRSAPTLFKKTTPPRTIAMPLSEVITNTETALRETADINQKFVALDSSTEGSLDLMDPDLRKNLTTLEASSKNLSTNYQKTIDAVTETLKDHYQKSLESLAKTAKQRESMPSFVIAFQAKIAEFKKTLSLNPDILPSDMTLTREQQEKYCTELQSYIKSRQGFTSLFRDTALTTQKELVTEEAIRLFRSLNSPSQLKAAIDLLLQWNSDLEFISGKKYSFGKHSELQEKLQNIRDDLSQAATPQPTSKR